MLVADAALAAARQCKRRSAVSTHSRSSVATRPRPSRTPAPSLLPVFVEPGGSINQQASNGDPADDTPLYINGGHGAGLGGMVTPLITSPAASPGPTGSSTVRWVLVQEQTGEHSGALHSDAALPAFPHSVPSPRRLRRYRALFDKYDAGGGIKVGSLGTILEKLGIFLPDQELPRLFDALDEDQSGTLSFQEFVGIVKNQRQLAQLALVVDDRSSLRQLRAHMQLQRWVLWPDGWGRCAWDCVILVVATWHAFVVPLQHALPDGALVSPLADAATLASAAVLLCDVCVRLFSATAPSYAQPATLFTTLYTQSWWAIAGSYVRDPGFAVDVAAAVPLDLALRWGGAPRAVFLCSAYLRLVKLLRVPSLFPVAGRALLTPVYARLHYGVFPLIRLAFMSVLGVHVFAVVWLLASDADDPQCGRRRGLAGYLNSLYFVCYTLTTVGYGDIAVTTAAQKGVSILLFFAATVVTGLVVGKLVQYNQEADVKTDTQRRMLETVSALGYLGIPDTFKQEILAFQHYRLHTSHQVFEDTLGGLPVAMTSRIELYARMNVLRYVPIFADLPDVCLARLAQALLSMTVSPDEYIIFAGEESDSMYFLLHGMCAVVLADGRWVAAIKRGGVFGQLAQAAEGGSPRHPAGSGLTGAGSGGSPRRSTSGVKALTYCQLFRLGADMVADVAWHFPQLRGKLRDRLQREVRDEEDALKRPPAAKDLSWRRRKSPQPQEQKAEEPPNAQQQRRPSPRRAEAEEAGDAQQPAHADGSASPCSFARADTPPPSGAGSPERSLPDEEDDSPLTDSSIVTVAVNPLTTPQPHLPGPHAFSPPALTPLRSQRSSLPPARPPRDAARAACAACGAAPADDALLRRVLLLGLEQQRQGQLQEERHERVMRLLRRLLSAQCDPPLAPVGA